MESTFKALDTIISREVYLPDPVYATLDLIITSGGVEGQMLDALFGAQVPQVQPGFFSPDNFTLGG